jgi:hypothetical protein
VKFLLLQESAFGAALDDFLGIAICQDEPTSDLCGPHIHPKNIKSFLLKKKDENVKASG